MNYIDHKYLMIVSVYLQGFKSAGKNLYNCRCPLCGDSTKNKSKRRGYFFAKDQSLIYKCHNCNASMSFYNFLAHFHSEILSQYKFEKFKSKNEPSVFDEPVKKIEKDASDVLSVCDKITELQEAHHARVYVEGRKIPQKHLKNLYYINNINKITKKIEAYKDKNYPSFDAIVIPFFDEEKKLTHVQFRFLDGDMRYMTLEIIETKKIWGLDTVDFNKHVYITEGPFDAMFIENSLACAGASILSESKYLLEKCLKGFTIVFDADYRTNKAVYNQMKTAVDTGHTVVFFDKYFSGKDVNDAVLAGMGSDELMEYLKNNSKTGLMAKLALTEFKPPT